MTNLPIQPLVQIAHNRNSTPHHVVLTQKHNVQAHIGINGNNQANILANEGATKPTITSIPHLHIVPTIPYRPAQPPSASDLAS